jgi:hypothetical protein
MSSLRVFFSAKRPLIARTTRQADVIALLAALDAQGDGRYPWLEST